MNTLIVLLIIALLIRKLNSYRLEISTLKTQNRLHNLKHELIMSYANGEMKCDQRGVVRLRTLIVGAESVLPTMNIWVILYYYVFRKKPITPTSQLVNISDYEHCPEFKRIYKEYSRLSVNYLFNKSVFSILTTALIVFFGKHISKKCARWLVALKIRIEFALMSKNDNNIRPSF